MFGTAFSITKEKNDDTCFNTADLGSKLRHRRQTQKGKYLFKTVRID